jgi:hypothetical protein
MILAVSVEGREPGVIPVNQIWSTEYEVNE